MQIPIACSLEPAAARAQLGEWRQLFGRFDNQDRVSPNRLELSLLPDSNIVDVVHLAQREIACCNFFTFTLEIRREQLVLAIEVPNDAIEVLDDLMSNVEPN